jgi:2-haloacid dehalogenase
MTVPRAIALDDDVAETLAARMRQLTPHPDAAGALTRLADAGFTLAALTNSPPDVARAQLEHAELADRFAAILSADDVRALKPRPEPYRVVAEHFSVPVADVRLVAAHAWDVSGALAAGCAAAFVRRAGKVPSPLGDQPDIVGDGLDDVADRIIEIDGRR